MNTVLDGSTWWVIAFALGIPLALIILTEVLGWLQQRSSPAVGRTVRSDRIS